jgi:hypothetical protein
MLFYAAGLREHHHIPTDVSLFAFGGIFGIFIDMELLSVARGMPPITVNLLLLTPTAS